MKKIIVSFVALFLTMLYSASAQHDDFSVHPSTIAPPPPIKSTPTAQSTPKTDEQSRDFLEQTQPDTIAQNLPKQNTTKTPKQNPAFNKNLNALRVEIGSSVRGNGFENHHNAQIIYSQPNHIFRIHGRINLELGGFLGFGNVAGVDLSSMNLAFLGISEEALLPIFMSQKYGNIYAGVGLGAYIKSKGEVRVISNFTFGERVFVGYLWKKFSSEIFIKHFSNGTLSKPNAGHNFFGLCFGYVF